jgi:flavin reductase
LSGLFAGKTPTTERFASAQWSTLATDAPALDAALANFDYRIRKTIDIGWS